MRTPAPDWPSKAIPATPDSSSPTRTRRRSAKLQPLDWFELFLLAIVTVFVFAQLRPDLLFNGNMDVGGDNAGHVAAVYYFVHTLLPKGQLSGWDPQWFGGFPLYVFYFPLPGVITAFFSSFLNFAVAFKLVTVLGSVILPACAYSFGRLAGFRRPTPILMAVASLSFLFNWSYTIMGGNIASTLAGEYSFSLACSTGLLFLGCVAYSLRTGRRRWLAALLLGITILCHVVPALFFAASALLFALIRRRPFQAVKMLVPIGAVGCLLAGFWLFRFAADLRYASSMNYSRQLFAVNQFIQPSAEAAAPVLAAIGMVIAIIRRNRFAFALAIMAVGTVVAYVVIPAGLVWNPRWIPFFYLAAPLLGAYALGEIGIWVFKWARLESITTWVTAPVVTLAIISITAFYIGDLPFTTTPPSMQIPLQGWVSWNYNGFQGKSGWPEFSRVVTMLDQAGAKYGCGRFDYEYTPNIQNTFGSTVAEMSLPMWTNGCMNSEEGIYFESSTSTPFHFLDQAELSIQASNPVVGLPYQPLNVADGIAHLQMTGTNYFLADSPEVENAADADPTLVRIASTPASPAEADGVTGTATKPVSWVLYRILNSQVVTALAYSPVVEGGLSKTAWLALGIRWYQNSADWSVPIALSGPSSWHHAATGTLETPQSARAIPQVTISSIHLSSSSVSFRVSKIGVPVLVKIPYFPNWKATGASRPVEVTPNDMVVTPTSTTVTLTYGTSTVDWVGRAGSLLGLGGLVAIWRPIPIPAFPAPRRRKSKAHQRGDRDIDSSPSGGSDEPAGGGFAVAQRQWRAE